MGALPPNVHPNNFFYNPQSADIYNCWKVFDSWEDFDLGKAFNLDAEAMGSDYDPEAEKKILDDLGIFIKSHISYKDSELITLGEIQLAASLSGMETQKTKIRDLLSAIGVNVSARERFNRLEAVEKMKDFRN